MKLLVVKKVFGQRAVKNQFLFLCLLQLPTNRNNWRWSLLIRVRLVILYKYEIIIHPKVIFILIQCYNRNRLCTIVLEFNIFQIIALCHRISSNKITQKMQDNKVKFLQPTNYYPALFKLLYFSLSLCLSVATVST